MTFNRGPPREAWTPGYPLFDTPIKGFRRPKSSATINGDSCADMNSFLLPFLLTLAMAVPIIWYHLDGTDPLDIAARAPSQEEIDFARTQTLLGDLAAETPASDAPLRRLRVMS